MIRTYSEMIKRSTLLERFRYLSIGGSVGLETFGLDRHINQKFYRSREWKQTRDYVIARDGGCDLGVEDFDIFDKILIHHMNPMTIDDLVSKKAYILDPEFLVCVSHRTHNAIHYGDESLLSIPPPERKPGDTLLW